MILANFYEVETQIVCYLGTFKMFLQYNMASFFQFDVSPRTDLSSAVTCVGVFVNIPHKLLNALKQVPVGCPYIYLTVFNLLIARFQSLPVRRQWIHQNHTIHYLWMLQKKIFVRKYNVQCQWVAKTILRLSIQLMKILVSMLECQPVVRLHFAIPLHWQGRIAVVVTLPIGESCCYIGQIIRCTP